MAPNAYAYKGYDAFSSKQDKPDTTLQDHQNQSQLSTTEQFTLNRVKILSKKNSSMMSTSQVAAYFKEANVQVVTGIGVFFS